MINSAYLLLLLHLLMILLHRVMWHAGMHSHGGVHSHPGAQVAHGAVERAYWHSGHISHPSKGIHRTVHGTGPKIPILNLFSRKNDSHVGITGRHSHRRIHTVGIEWHSHGAVAHLPRGTVRRPHVHSRSHWHSWATIGRISHSQGMLLSQGSLNGSEGYLKMKRFGI